MVADDGAVLSMLTKTVAFAVLPALSTAVPTTGCFAASFETVTGAGHDRIPDSESEHVKLTVTFVLFQPFAFAAGDAVAVIAGGVGSVVEV